MAGIRQNEAIRSDIRQRKTAGNGFVWIILCLLIAATQITYPQQQIQKIKYIKLTYSEPMQRETIKDKANYSVFDASLNRLEIKRVGLEPAPVDSVVYLEIAGPKYKTSYIVRAAGVKDKAGNEIAEHNSVWFFNDGYNGSTGAPSVNFGSKPKGSKDGN